LKKETIITAIVFFGVGFLAGYIYDAHQSSNPQPAASAGISQQAPGAGGAAGEAADTSGAPGGAMPGLPQGHPPINTDSMIKALQDQAAQNPQDPEAPLRLANVLYDHQRFSEAIEWYQKALKLDPKNVDARTDLGTCFFNLGQPKQALAEYRKSLQSDPRHEATLFNMIVVNLEGTHDLAAARDAWEQLHRLNPNYRGLDQLKQRLDAAGGAAAP
jgi:cytochrome c-type biogenesis protein CcmH/NrfG